MFAKLTAAIVLTCTACLAVSAASAQERLIVSTQGSVDKAVREFIAPKMKQLYGVELSTIPSLSAPALAKAIAQKGRPQIDVFLLDAGPWLQGKAQGLWAKIPEGSLPNLADTDRLLDDENGVAYAHLVVGLLYDSSKVKQPPTSLRDLEDPKYKGELAVPTFSSTFAFALLAKLDKLNGGTSDPAHPLDAGFAAMKRIAPNIASYYGSGSQLVDLFKQSEIEIAWGANYIAHSLGPSSPVRWTAPREGAALSTVYAAIAQGTDKTDAAAKFLNLLISPEFQAVMAEQSGLGYVNTKTVLSPEFAKTSPLTPAVMKAGTQLPWAIFNKRRVELNERWQRELEGR